MNGHRSPARSARPILSLLTLVAFVLPATTLLGGQSDRADRASRNGERSLPTAGPAEGLAPAEKVFIDVRTNLQEYVSIFDLGGMEEGLAALVRSRSYMIGRAGYELLALDGASAVDSGQAVSEEKGVGAMLARIRALLGDSDAGRLLARSLVLRRRGPEDPLESASLQQNRRAEADRILEALLFRGDRSWTDDRLAGAREIFTSLGDAEGLGSFLAAAAPRASSLDETRALFDESAEAFDRANDVWSAASSREASVLAGDPDLNDPMDLERLERAASGYEESGDAASEARARLAFGQRLLDAGRGRQALSELRAAGRLLEAADGTDEARKLCARGIADAVLQIVETIDATKDPSEMEDLLAEGEAAAKRAGSPNHEAWIVFERARIRALPAGATPEALAGARRALTIFRANANDEGIAESASLLGDWAASSRLHGEAAAYYREAALSSAALGESEAQRSLSVLRAEELRRGGHFDVAGRLAKTLLDAGGLTPPRRQDALAVLGDALLVSGRPVEAEIAYAQAQEISFLPAIPPRRAAALIRAGRPSEARAILQPVVASGASTRLEERLFEEASKLAGERMALPPVPDAAAVGARNRGRVAARLLADGRRDESIQAAKDLASTDEPLALFDAAALAAGAGEQELARGWAKRALGRGLDGFLLELDPDLVFLRELPQSLSPVDSAVSPDLP